MFRNPQLTYLFVIVACVDALMIPWGPFQALVVGWCFYDLWKTRPNHHLLKEIEHV